jgi:hypothetical protein
VRADASAPASSEALRCQWWPTGRRRSWRGHAHDDSGELHSSVRRPLEATTASTLPSSPVTWVSTCTSLLPQHRRGGGALRQHMAACQNPPRRRHRRPLMYDFPQDFTMCVKNPHARKITEAMRKQLRKHARSHVIEKRSLHAFPRCESSFFVQKHNMHGRSRKRCGSKVRKQTFH